MAFESYVIDSANQMNKLLIRVDLDPEGQGNELTEASVIGCRTLSQLADDTEFRRALDRMAHLRLNRSGGTTQEFKDLLDDVGRFEHFLVLEREVLIKGGINADLAGRLVDQCRAVVSMVRDRAQPSDEALEAVRSLRDQACDRSRVLVEQASNIRRASEMDGQLWKITIGIGGAALVGLNAAIAATTGVPSVGLTIAGAAVSSAFGVAIIKNATTTTPRTRPAGGGASMSAGM